MQMNTIPFVNNLDEVLVKITLWVEKGGVKMGMEMAGSILGPALLVLKLPVVLARMPGKITTRQRL